LKSSASLSRRSAACKKSADLSSEIPETHLGSSGETGHAIADWEVWRAIQRIRLRRSTELIRTGLRVKNKDQTVLARSLLEQQLLLTVVLVQSSFDIGDGLSFAKGELSFKKKTSCTIPTALDDLLATRMSW
jgi:hypothetical protein